MRCAIYARYSSDMQSPESIEDQVRQCRKYLTQQGWALSDGQVFSDYAVSGSDDKRSGYLAMREAGRRRDFDVLLVDDQTRLGRHALEALSAIEELIGLGIRIIGVSDGLDTSSKVGKTAYLIKSVFGELFLDNLRDSVNRGLRGRVERGYSAGGRVFGYRYTDILDENGAKDRFGVTRRVGVSIEIDPEQAKIVRKIFDLSARGYGLKGIVSLLNESMTPAPRKGRKIAEGGTWCTGTVHSVLRNPKYIGDWTYGKTRWVSVGHGEHKKRRPVDQPRENWTPSIRKDLRIVEQSVWDAVQKRTSTNVLRSNEGKLAGSRTNSGPAKYLFSGLLKCGECGASMIVISSGGYSSYVCNNFWNRGKTVCRNNRRIARRVIESDLLSGIQRLLLDDRIVQEVVDGLNIRIAEAMKSKPSKSRDLKAEADRLEKEIDNLVGFVSQGDTSTRIRQKLQDAERRLFEVQAQISGADQPLPRLKQIDLRWVRDRIGSVNALLNNHTKHTDVSRRELANILGEKITLNPIANSRNWAYEAEGILKPAKVFVGGSLQDSVVALRGFDRVIEREVPVEYRLKVA